MAVLNILELILKEFTCNNGKILWLSAIAQDGLLLFWKYIRRRYVLTIAYTNEYTHFH